MEDKDKKQKKPNFIWKSILKDGKGVKKEDVINRFIYFLILGLRLCEINFTV